MRLHDLLDYRASLHPDAEFGVHGDRRLTYGEARAAANRLANALVAQGLGVGDRVAILSKNSLEYVLLYFACSKAGVVPVPLNYRLSPGEWRFILDDAGAAVLFASAEYVPAVDALRPELGGVARCVAIDGAARAGWDDLRCWAAGQPATAPDHRIDESADLYQMYTSGTTRRPKGAVLPQRAATINVAQCVLSGLTPVPGERWLIAIPLYHTAAATISFIGIAGAPASSSSPTSTRPRWSASWTRSASPLPCSCRR